MIGSVRSKALRRFAETGDASKLAIENVARLRRTLPVLDAASTPQAMDQPGWRLHALKGRRKGAYSVGISGNWRLVVRWADGHAVDVDLEDYH